jgi:hypothetical protein
MEKINKDKLKKITEQLKPYWRNYWKIWKEFSDKTHELEIKMNDKIKINTPLEFFYVDGECVGIGALNFEDRESFPLIQDRDLN